MPIHDWSRAEASLFHAFRHRWLGALCDAMNDGLLPEDHFAMIEEASSLARESVADSTEVSGAGDPAVARRADCIAVRRGEGGLVAVVEVVSPGDKASEAGVRALVGTIAALIGRRVHVLVVDLFPPGSHDPRGIHNAIWDAIEPEELEVPADRPLTVASYDAGAIPVTYVEPAAVGDFLPEMPLFVEPGSYVAAPLEATYQAAWEVFPAGLKGRLMD